MFIDSNMKQRKQIIEGREVFIFQEKNVLWGTMAVFLSD